jgi:hypothetical protein
MSLMRNFAFLIAIQFAVVAALLLYRAIPLRRAALILLRSALFGLPIGVCFDLLIGKYNTVFSYYPTPDVWTFYVLNAALSYGAAIATAWIVPGRLQPAKQAGLAWLTWLLFFASAALLLFLPVNRLPTLVVMFVGGGLVLVMAECAAAVASLEGAMLAALHGRPAQALRLWAIGIAVGAIYELANTVFPVWRWQPLPGLSHGMHELLIVTLGYVVLFYPLFVATRILEPDA